MRPHTLTDTDVDKAQRRAWALCSCGRRFTEHTLRDALAIWREHKQEVAVTEGP